MKILLVIDDYFTTNNGTSISGQRFVGELRRRGHEVRVLTYVRPEQETDKSVYRLPELRVPFFDDLIHSYAVCLAKPDHDILTRAISWADIIHCMMPFPMEYRAKQIADYLGVPSTSAFHIQPENITSAIGMGKVDWVNNLTYWLFRHYTYDKYTHVHTPSKFMENLLRDHDYHADIRAISNGIADEFVYRRAGQKRPEWQGKYVVCMIGRLAREKRQDVLIDAVSKSKYADRIQLVLAGKGPLREEYEQQIDGLHLTNRPIFGYYSKEELLDVLAETDLYVHCSDMESEAISCIEAFATGLVPVIADSPVSATPQFALDERSLFAPGDSSALAARIDYWLEHPDEREAMGRTYAQHADQYRLTASADKFEQMLRDALVAQDPANAEEPVQPAAAAGGRRMMGAAVLCTMLLLCFSLLAQAGNPQGDFEQWTVRKVKESAIFGGQTRAIDDIAGPWATSNTHACVMGIDKAATSVYPTRHDGGTACLMKVELLSFTAMGIPLNAVAAGSIFLGETNEPVDMHGANEPMTVLNMNYAYSGRPEALFFDYACSIADSRDISEANASKKVKHRDGRDGAEVIVILQRRWEDADGQIHAQRVATGWERIMTSFEGWVDAHSIPLRYGDISRQPGYETYQGLNRQGYMARNSRGKMVTIQEEDYAADAQPTHLILMFSAGCQSAFSGHVGNWLKVDNVVLR